MQVNGARALIKRLDAQDMQSKLIEIVRYEAPPSQFAVVIEAGNGDRLPSGVRRPLDFKKGDMVITKPYCGALVPIDGEDYYMVVEEDILAICEV